MTQNKGAIPGSHASHEAATHLRPSGVDPERCELKRYDSISQRIVDMNGNVIGLILQLSNRRWIVELNGTRAGPWSCRSPQAAFLTWRNKAIATEARRAETPKSGSVHEGAGRNGIAQTQSAIK